MKYFILTLSICFFCMKSFSQETYSKNNIYIELLGKGFYYSINYERKLFRLNEIISTNASIGISVFPGLTSIEKSTDILLPVENNFCFSKQNHHAVVGYGTTFWSYKVNYIDIDNTNLSQQPLPPSLIRVNEWFAHLLLEYRFQKPSGGFLFKVGYCPLFFAPTENTNFNKNSNYQTSFNLGIGWSF